MQIQGQYLKFSCTLEFGGVVNKKAGSISYGLMICLLHTGPDI